MKCFFHYDNDGYCSFFIVKRKYPHIQGISLDYVKPFPYESINKNELVIIVDYSFKDIGELQKILDITENLIWIDHHITSYKLGQLPIKGKRSNYIPAACFLCWEYFCSDKPMPEVVALVSDYDTWSFKFGDRTKLFNLGLTVYNNASSEDIWDSLLDDRGDRLIEKIIQEGQTIKNYMDVYRETLLNYATFEATFEGYNALVVNACRMNAEIFKHVKQRDIMSVYYFNGETYNVTIYSEKIDCEELARRFGGGGHKGSAGFKTKEFPFKSLNRISSLT